MGLFRLDQSRIVNGELIAAFPFSLFQICDHDQIKGIVRGFNCKAELNNSFYFISDCYTIRMADNIRLGKYSSLRAGLAEDNSDSDEESHSITQTLCQLLPVYYQYRKYLVQMLKQTNFNLRLNSNLLIPQQYLQEKAKKCEAEKDFCEQKIKNNLTCRVSRMLITEKVLQKRRKKLKEEKQLERKYEAQEIEALMHRQKSNKNNQQQLTFEPKKTQHPSAFQNIQKYSRNLLCSLDPNYSQEQDPSIHEQGESAAIEYIKPIKPKSSQLFQTCNQDPSKPEKSGNAHVLETDRFDQILETNNNESQKGKCQNFIHDTNEHPGTRKAHTPEDIPKIKNSSHTHRYKNPDKINRQQRTANQERCEQVKSKAGIRQKRLIGSSGSNGKSPERNQSQTGLPPKIRINYQNLEKEEGSSEDNERSQDGDFSDIMPNKLNIVEVERSHADETYSQQKAKPYSRNNTPNFDTFSQKIKTGNFFEMQKQKLLAQQQFAERIQSQVDAAEGVDESASISSKIQKILDQNSIIDNTQSIKNAKKKVSTGKICSTEIENQFLSSIRYMLFQIIDLYSNAECYKYMLKHKQYEILKKLYDEQVGKGPIFAKLLARKIQQLLKDPEKSETNTILTQIFGSQNFINFEDFGNIFNSDLVENQYCLISPKVSSFKPHEIQETISRLFSVWLEINYFQTKIKRILQSNPTQLRSICGKVTRITDQSTLDYQQLQKFVYSTSRVIFSMTQNRSNGVKIKIFCRKYFPQSKFSEFSNWFHTKITGK